jgi:hypothetical protein
MFRPSAWRVRNTQAKRRVHLLRTFAPKRDLRIMRAGF